MGLPTTENLIIPVSIFVDVLMKPNTDVELPYVSSLSTNALDTRDRSALLKRIFPEPGSEFVVELSNVNATTVAAPKFTALDVIFAFMSNLSEFIAFAVAA